MNALITLCIVLFGLMCGFFYAFSCTVMPGLDLTDPDAAVAAMQGINRAVRSPVFFVTFFLTPLFSLAAALLLARKAPRAALFMGGAGAVYLGAALILTMQVNVPMNEALAQVKTDADMAAIWAAYSPDWTFWNHVRTAASVIAAALACGALAAYASGKDHRA